MTWCLRGHPRYRCLDATPRSRTLTSPPPPSVNPVKAPSCPDQGRQSITCMAPSCAAQRQPRTAANCHGGAATRRPPLRTDRRHGHHTRDGTVQTCGWTTQRDGHARKPRACRGTVHRARRVMAPAPGVRPSGVGHGQTAEPDPVRPPMPAAPAASTPTTRRSPRRRFTTLTSHIRIVAAPGRGRTRGERPAAREADHIHIRLEMVPDIVLETTEVRRAFHLDLRISRRSSKTVVLESSARSSRPQVHHRGAGQPIRRTRPQFASTGVPRSGPYASRPARRATCMAACSPRPGPLVRSGRPPGRSVYRRTQHPPDQSRSKRHPPAGDLPPGTVDNLRPGRPAMRRAPGSYSRCSSASPHLHVTPRRRQAGRFQVLSPLAHHRC